MNSAQNIISAKTNDETKAKKKNWTGLEFFFYTDNEKL